MDETSKDKQANDSFRAEKLTMEDYLRGNCVGRTRDGVRVRFSKINSDVSQHSSWRVRSEYIGFGSGFYHDTEGNFLQGGAKDKRDIISFE